MPSFCSPSDLLKPAGTIFFFFFNSFFLFLLFLLLFLFSPLFAGSAIFVLPLCLAPTDGHHLCTFSATQVPASPRGELPHMSGAPVSTSGDLGFVAATQRMPLNHLALEARGA